MAARQGAKDLRYSQTVVASLSDLADIVLRVPARRTDRVQELHVMVYHALCEMIELEFFG